MIRKSGDVIRKSKDVIRKSGDVIRKLIASPRSDSAFGLSATFADSEESAHVAVVGLALEPLAW